MCSVEVSISDSNSNTRPNVITAMNYVTFTSQDLNLGWLYTVTVLARNFGGSTASQTSIRKFVEGNLI